MKDFIMENLVSLNTLSLSETLVKLFIALIIGGTVYMAYYLTSPRVAYNGSFGISLVAMTVITTAIMAVISSNIALSLGMVGALSIVRFRTAIKDSRDTIYIFWTIVTGICCGAGDFLIAGIGCTFTFLILLIFGRIKNDNRMLFIIRTARVNEQRIEALMFQYFTRKANLRVKNTTENSVEFIYEISKRVLDRLGKGKEKSIIDAIYEIGNIEYCNIVMQNDEISS